MTTKNARGRVSVEKAYHELREAIVSGRLMPNQRLVEADLTAQLGVSRATIRSVLSRLHHDGLIVHEYNYGARVRMVTVEEAVELLEARAVLEGLAAGQAALHASEEEVRSLTGILARMSELIDNGDVLGYSECNRQLHATVTTASHHNAAQRLLVDLKAQIVRFQYRTILLPGRPRQSLAEHTALVEAIVAHDVGAAEAAARQHLLHVSEALRQSDEVEPAEILG